MSHNSPAMPTHLSTPRPYSPSPRHIHDRSPNLTTGSATQTLTNTPQRSESPEPLVLRLRGAHIPSPDYAEFTSGNSNSQRRQRPHIQWAEDVIDNEGLGRKKSKVCCIYHKPRAVGESSDESSSDSSSDSEGGSGSDFERDGARPVAGGRKGRGRKHSHDHGHGENGHGDGDGDGDGCGHSHQKPKQQRRPSPNAYEKMPKYDVKPLEKQPGSGS